MRPSIVCGVDGSPESEAALEVAARLSNQLGLRLVVAHIADAVRVPHAPAVPFHDAAVAAQSGDIAAAGDEAALQDRARQEDAARRLLEDVVAACGLPEAAQRVAVGLPAEELAAIADEECAKLVAVGSRRRGPFRAAFFGSVSNRLVGVAPCPVVIVPLGADGVSSGALHTAAERGRPARLSYPRDVLSATLVAAGQAAEETRTVSSPTVVCGVDGVEMAREVLRVAGDLSDRLGARLVLAHVAVPPVIPGVSAVPGAAEEMIRTAADKARMRLEELAGLEHQDGHVEHRVAFGAPGPSLTTLARAYAADLLIVGRRPRGRLASALLGSVSAHLARSAPCPVVVVGANAVLERSAVIPGPSAVSRDRPAAGERSEQRRRGRRSERDRAQHTRL